MLNMNFKRKPLDLKLYFEPTMNNNKAVNHCGEIVELSSQDLYVDYNYQRTLNRKEVDYIFNNFNPYSVGVLTVAKRESRDGKYAICDGQHRFEAMRKYMRDIKHKDEFKVRCIVHDESMGVKNEARSFIDFNRNVAIPDILMLWSSRYHAGDSKVSKIVHLFSSQGFCVGRLYNGTKPSPKGILNNFSCVKAIENAYDLFNSEHKLFFKNTKFEDKYITYTADADANLCNQFMIDTINIIKNAFHEDNKRVQGPLFNGVIYTLEYNYHAIKNKYGLSSTAQRYYETKFIPGLIKAMSKKDAEYFLREFKLNQIKKYGDIHGGSVRIRCASDVLVDAYNKANKYNSNNKYAMQHIFPKPTHK